MFYFYFFCVSVVTCVLPQSVSCSRPAPSHLILVSPQVFAIFSLSGIPLNSLSFCLFLVCALCILPPTLCVPRGSLFVSCHINSLIFLLLNLFFFLPPNLLSFVCLLGSNFHKHDKYKKHSPQIPQQWGDQCTACYIWVCVAVYISSYRLIIISETFGVIKHFST